MTPATCDRCGATLPPTGARYRLTVTLAVTEGEPDCDPVRATAGWLDELESGDALAAEYELCRGCRARFIADPLGRAAGGSLRFSWN